jgi:hypothetical protein
MKTIFVVAMAFALSACSMQRAPCRGSLQPINKPVIVVGPTEGVPTESRP